MRFAPLALLLLANVGHAEDAPKLMLSFDTLYGVEGPFMGSQNRIRGLAGDDLPWQVGAVHGVVTTTGHVHIRVEGLVFPNRPPVPFPLRGINDEPYFRAVVSCLTEGPFGGVRGRNISTQPFPANADGDSVIDDDIALPESCVAPIVFILPGDEDYWFAVSGAEAD